MSINRLTGQAQEALQRAQQIMRARKQSQLDVEHLFLALLQQQGGLPANLIAILRADVQALVDSLEKDLDGRPSHTASIGTVPSQMTLRVEHVLRVANEEAARFGEQSVSTGHLLLAIADEE